MTGRVTPSGAPDRDPDAGREASAEGSRTLSVVVPIALPGVAVHAGGAPARLRPLHSPFPKGPRRGGSCRRVAAIFLPLEHVWDTLAKQDGAIHALLALTGFANGGLAFHGENAQQPLGKAAHPGPNSRPNVVFMLTKNQGLHIDPLEFMPWLKKRLIDQDTQHNKQCTTMAICRPARVSLWTSGTTHNTNVTGL